ncbi:class I SAM-dependent methyltransferase [Streptomyces aureoverticillatus]|uniref:class I SAM-dependent methyltransferase n=1 Tax=Streptomyces aureoverticillatus TaxID=66871 RepID=UPI0013D929A8|nr:class I SAM-dependent methyltransferase [Streptomyces aureoverticillatus]QIB46200.1 class I SAM-dependent methyltransferase [Streptomyces aureoverticillatus]
MDLARPAPGTGALHEPRRDDCPWCGSPRLRVRLRTADLIQRKPGSFTLERCADCAHTFQNPRLSAEGLDFYRQGSGRQDLGHRDFWRQDLCRELGGGATALLTRAGAGRARSLAGVRALSRFDEPESWLDVGTGRARFPAAAKDVLPYTAFDGLDSDPALAEGARRGRIEEAHRGRLTDLAGNLAGRYDALSMIHYLQRRPDPRAELRAAATALRPGGHLLIEAPDPESRSARLLGKWWASYRQPRHAHFVPLANLCRELDELGFTVVDVDRRAPHVPSDLGAACALLLNRLLPEADAPWRAEPPSRSRLTLRRTAWWAAWWAATPLLALAYAADVLLAPLLTRTGFANAYRVIARRERDA